MVKWLSYCWLSVLEATLNLIFLILLLKDNIFEQLTKTTNRHWCSGRISRFVKWGSKGWRPPGGGCILLRKCSLFTRNRLQQLRPLEWHPWARARAAQRPWGRCTTEQGWPSALQGSPSSPLPAVFICWWRPAEENHRLPLLCCH